MIQYIYLLTTRRLSFFVTVGIDGRGGFRIGFVSGRIAAILVALLRRIIPDLIDIFQFMAQDGLLGNAINHFLLSKILQLIILFMLELIILFHSIGPTFYGSCQSISYGLLVGTLTKTVFRAMQHKFYLVHYFLLAKYAITLCNVMLGHISNCCLYRKPVLDFFLRGALMDS